MTTRATQFGVLAGAIFLTALAMFMFMNISRSEASVSITSEYMATSTAPVSAYGATISTTALIKSGNGTLGSVIITGANTGIVNIYNATTTNINNRTNKTATSTILIASFPASAAAGTYTFDVQFTDGLLVDLVSGTMPTSTITYRR